MPANKIKSDVCRVPGCGRPRLALWNGKGHLSLCTGHQSRKSRLGDIQADIPLRSIAPNGAGSVDKFGYIIDFLPSHPLATKSGLVPRHRQILYDAIGAGLHPCHWCAKPVAWEDPQPHGLQVDHLDADKQNNVVTNLVPACKPCNFLRAVAGNPLDFVRV